MKYMGESGLSKLLTLIKTKIESITASDIGAASAQHTHNYAGSSSAGGAATSANKLATTRNINGMNFNGTSNVTNYSTCSTGAATVEKTVSCANFSLITGAEITVKFTVTNTAASPTLNVNSTGAKPIYYRGSAISADYLAANRSYTFRYNGTQYELVGDLNTNTTYTPASLGFGYGTCTTEQDTTEKVVTLSNYSLVTNGIVAIKFSYGVPYNSTLNINGKGAKSIYYHGTKILAGVIRAGDIAYFIYNTQYHLIGIDRNPFSEIASVDTTSTSTYNITIDDTGKTFRESARASSGATYIFTNANISAIASGSEFAFIHYARNSHTKIQFTNCYCGSIENSSLLGGPSSTVTFQIPDCFGMAAVKKLFTLDGVSYFIITGNVEVVS